MTDTEHVHVDGKGGDSYRPAASVVVIFSVSQTRRQTALDRHRRLFIHRRRNHNMNENTVRRLALDCSSTQEATSTVHTQMYIFPYPDRSQTGRLLSLLTPHREVDREATTARRRSVPERASALYRLFVASPLKTTHFTPQRAVRNHHLRRTCQHDQRPMRLPFVPFARSVVPRV